MKDKLTVGLGVTGSFCTHRTLLKAIDDILLTDDKIEFLPILSYNAANTDTRFGKAEDLKKELEKKTGKKPIETITDAEPVGPSGILDAMIIAPCTGNTLAKLNLGITDTPVLMAAKAHLRNNKPLILFISTNDALGNNLKNIADLYNKKNITFVPFAQDDPVKKPNSLISKPEFILPAIKEALKGKQLQPVIAKD